MIVEIFPEVRNIQISIHSERKAVSEFLEALREVLYDANFNVDRNLVVIRKSKSVEKEQFSTPYTLADLDYDYFDVIDRLKELTIRDYSETKIDKDDDNPPLLFVFGKDINERMVYIKLKIKGEERRRVLCLSFHYAEKQMEFPYA